MTNSLVQQQNKTRDDAATFAGIGAVVGAGLGACIGLLAANPELRHKIFSSYSDMKEKGIEIYRDIERIQQERNRHRGKVKFIKPAND